jgi:hypothetical protein
VASADALRLRETFFEPPAIICYFDRGTGAQPSAAPARLPGGGANAVAIIKVPRERMIGSGIASSLFHEVGHQAAAMLGLASRCAPAVRAMSYDNPRDAPAWRLWERWISEILADFWSVARVGIAATIELMAVVSLPRPLVRPVWLNCLSERLVLSSARSARCKGRTSSLILRFLRRRHIAACGFGGWAVRG